MKQQLHTVVKTIVAILFIHLISNTPVFAQLHGTYTIDNTLAASATNYKNFTSAAGDLNSGTRTDGGHVNGPGASGDVTFNVAAGETFSESPVIITYTNSPNWYNITFQNAATPGINNPTLEGTTGVGDSDAVIKLLGGSYYTFNGINLSDNASNTTPTTEMEYGVYLSALTASGCQYNTFENGTITLNKTNTNLPTGVFTNSDASSSAGTNSYNTFTNLTVQNVITGYSLNGNSSFLGTMDDGNVINTSGGGRSEITNAGPSAANNGTIAEGIYCIAQNSLTVSNTTINNLNYYNTSGSNTGAIYGIFSDGGFGTSPSGTFTFNADTIQGAGLGSGSTAAASITGIYLNTLGLNTAITNCVMNGLNSSLSGSTINGIYIGAITNVPTTLTISGNRMSNFNNTGSDILGLSNAPIGDATNVINMFNNSLSGFTTTGAGTVYGIELESQTLSFHNNSMSSFTGGTSGIYGLYLVGPPNLTQFHDDTLTGFTAPGTVVGLDQFNGGASDIPVYNCVLSNFSTTTSATAYTEGLSITDALTDTVYDNHIYTFTNSSSTNLGQVVGLYIGAGPDIAGSAAVVYNNMIYDLQANNSILSTAGGAVVGIELPDVNVTGALIKLYDNTVFLNGTAAVGGQYSSALFIGNGNDAVGNAYDIRNNIFVNDYSVPDVYDHAVSFWYNTLNTDFLDIGTTTNNNLLYAGTPSAKNLIFYCQGSDSVQTLAAYQTLLDAGKEAKSVTENPPFISATTPINAHINNTIYTQAESGGQVITSPAINTDIDGNIRAGSAGYTGCGTAPDIGANEFCGIPDTAFAILGPVSVEQGQTGIIFSVSPIPDATGYNWSLPSGATITAGANTNSITVSFAGVITGTDNVSVYATNCCGNGIAHKSAIMVASGIDQLSSINNQLLLYPNPASSQLTVSSSELPIQKIEMTNVLGQVIYISASNDSGVKQSIDVSTLAMGIYFVSVTCDNKTVTSKISVVR
jgi:trimeric autotransporter adhesin